MRERLIAHLRATARAVRARIRRWTRPSTQLSGLVGEWLERLGAELQSLGDAIEDDVTEVVLERREIRRAKLSAFDQTHVYVADESTVPTIAGVVIPARGRVTAAFTIRAPTGGAPGDRFRLDVTQRDASSKKMLGGSTYVVAIMKPPRAAKRKSRAH